MTREDAIKELELQIGRFRFVISSCAVPEVGCPEILRCCEAMELSVKICKIDDKSGMTNDAAISILECMAVDLAGGLTGLNRMNPMYDVLKQRLEAIHMAQEALRKEGTP